MKKSYKTISREPTFARLQKKGAQINTKHFTMIYCAKQSLDDEDICFITSKKFSKLAVNRNKVRRRLKSIVSFYYNIVPTLHNYSIMIIVKKQILDAKFKEINKCFKAAIEEIQ